MMIYRNSIEAGRALRSQKLFIHTLVQGLKTGKRVTLPFHPLRFLLLLRFSLASQSPRLHGL
jgi:hypothetical protein